MERTVPALPFCVAHCHISRGDSDRSTESRGVHTAGIQPPEQGSLGQGEEMRFYEKMIRSVEDQSLPVFSVRRTMEAMMVGCQ